MGEAQGIAVTGLVEETMPTSSPDSKGSASVKDAADIPIAEPSKEAGKGNMPKWQDRLLPLMVGLLLGLTIFFFVSTFIQMTYLHRSIMQIDPINLSYSADVPLPLDYDEWVNARQLEINSTMEAFVVSQRYRVASVMLMANLWIRYLGFITGMTLSLVGASFILGKLREPVQQIKGSFSDIGLSLRTTSPGIILVVLGVILMFTTLVDEDLYNIEDGSIYLLPKSGEITPEDTSTDLLAPVRPAPTFGNVTPGADDSSLSEPP